jgi:hypothetical protein
MNNNLPSVPPPPRPPQPPSKEQQEEAIRKLPPAHRKQVELQRKLMSELIFPPYIPRKCMPNTKPLDLLITQMKAGVGDGGAGDGNSNDNVDTPISLFTKEEWDRIKHPQPGTNGLSNTSPWEHVHHIDRSCRQFKLKHLHAKVKALNAKKRLIESGGQSTADASTYEEEKARSVIMDMNHKFCQNQVSCPERMNRLATCWSAFGPVAIKKFTEAGQEGLICKRERESVERCSGNLVQRLMRSATDDDSF